MIAVPGVAAEATPMKLRSYLPGFKDEGRVIAIFGQARLLKYFDGKYEPMRTSEATTPRGTTKPGGWSFACAVVNSDSSLKSCAAAAVAYWAADGQMDKAA